MQKLSKKSIRGAIAMAAAVLLLSACSSSPTTYSAADQAVDFRAYESYAFMDELATDREPYQSLESTYLKKSVAREMEKRGFVKSERPDVVINFSVESQEKMRSRSVPMGGVYADPFYGYDYGIGYGGGYGTHVDQYTEGKLRIYAVEVDSQRIVWEGTAKERLTQKKQADIGQTLDNAVVEVFRHFPVSSPQAELVSYTAQ